MVSIVLEFVFIYSTNILRDRKNNTVFCTAVQSIINLKALSFISYPTIVHTTTFFWKNKSVTSY